MKITRSSADVAQVAKPARLPAGGMFSGRFGNLRYDRRVEV
jgi:hypothetical protein